MKSISFLLAFFFLISKLCSQDIVYKEYSYTAFFHLIEQEQDTIFSLKDAIISYKEVTDSLFMVEVKDTSKVSFRKKQLRIDKEINLSNVHFLANSEFGSKLHTGIIANVVFEKRVELTSTISAQFYDCVFEKNFISRSQGNFGNLSQLEQRHFYLSFGRCTFKKGAIVLTNLMASDTNFDHRIEIEDCDIYTYAMTGREDMSRFYVFGRNITQLSINNNSFYGDGIAHYRAIENIFHTVRNNNFNNTYAQFYIDGGVSFNRLTFSENTFNKPVLLDVGDYSRRYVIPIKQFAKGLLSDNGMNRFQSILRENLVLKDINMYNDSIYNLYQAAIIENEEIHDLEIGFKAQLHSFYKSNFNNRSANIVYVETKNIETDRSKFLYNESPSFKSFFTWKVNQFLKIFSAYATEPARAIVFSLYVILFFSFIYLFFPNSWDKHGKNRIVDRYNFFFKYMKRKAGIHEVYLEDQKDELMSYEQFKNTIADSKQQVPKFFTATALPLYKWAISGTKLSASILKRVDIMKGTWQELPKKKRIWKSVLLVGAFVTAVLYDIIIKMLNALMLSINTFTTLGFGEIPIKGLPRYLAIIQGFIGWFMLTIFSVSLISQLLN